MSSNAFPYKRDTTMAPEDSESPKTSITEESKTSVVGGPKVSIAEEPKKSTAGEPKKSTLGGAKKSTFGDAKKSTADGHGTSRSDHSTGSKSSLPGMNLREQFKVFSKFGDTGSDGKHITLSQSDKWMKQAKVIDKTITTTDTGIHFKKFKAHKITYADFKKFLEDLAETKKVDVSDIEQKLSACSQPGVQTTAAHSKIDDTVARLTDTSKYTGSHKERFDESGKGKGIAGRKETADETGYVSGYHNKDSYKKSH